VGVLVAVSTVGVHEEETVVRSFSKLITRAVGRNPVKSGVSTALRGLRTGDQRVLLGGAALAAFGWLRSRKPERELVYRREIPEGSSVVVRYGKKGALPKIDVRRRDDVT
jgi:hypothetical protein